jgi:Tfp pilus assembly protein PilX
MNHQGMALVTGLILLAAISLLALFSTSGMLLQNQMASNLAQGAIALENSEIAVTYARAWLQSRANHEREDGCLSDCLLPTAIRQADEIPAHVEYESAAWWRSNALAAGIHPVTGESDNSLATTGAEPPRWLLQELHYSETEGAHDDGTQGIAYYRILGRGTGAHPSSVAVIESIIARPWGGDYTLGLYPPQSPDDFCRQFPSEPSPSIDCGRLAWRQRR